MVERKFYRVKIVYLKSYLISIFTHWVNFGVSSWLLLLLISERQL